MHTTRSQIKLQLFSTKDSTLTLSRGKQENYNQKANLIRYFSQINSLQILSVSGLTHLENVLSHYEYIGGTHLVE